MTNLGELGDYGEDRKKAKAIAHNRQEPPQKERHLKPIIASQEELDKIFDNIFYSPPEIAKREFLAAINSLTLKQVLEGRIDENKQWLDHFFQSVPKADIKSRIKALEAELKKENP